MLQLPHRRIVFPLGTHINLLCNPRKCSASSILGYTSGPSISRSVSSGAVSEFVQDSQESDDLKTRIFRLRLPKRSVTNVLQKWVYEGNQITISELRQISKDLRMSQRHKHALEVWIFSFFFSCFLIACMIFFFSKWIVFMFWWPER